MNPLLIYLAGVLTPIVVLAAAVAAVCLRGWWREGRDS